MAIISLSKINKYFGSFDNKVHIIKDISLSINKGEFVSIIGQSGSGKSTLMNLIGCLDTPSSGSYKIKDLETKYMDLDEKADLKCKTFGFVFQRYNLLSNLTAIENVALPAIYEGMNTDQRIKRATELLKK